MCVPVVASPSFPEPPTSEGEVLVWLRPDLAPAAAARMVHPQCSPYVAMYCEYRPCVV